MERKKFLWAECVFYLFIFIFFPILFLFRFFFSFLGYQFLDATASDRGFLFPKKQIKMLTNFQW